MSFDIFETLLLLVVFRNDSKSLRNKANKNEGKSIPYRTPILSEK